MASDERLRKAQAAGVDFIETARAKAEEFLRELGRAGGETQGALDDLVVGGRRTTEQLVAAVSKEIRSQLNSLGLVTKLDLQALEARLTGRRTTVANGGAPAPAAKATAPPAKAARTASTTKAARKTAPAKATATRAAATKATAAKAPAAKSRAATKATATKATATKAGGATTTSSAKKAAKKSSR